MKLKTLLLPIAALVGLSFTAHAASIGVNTGPNNVGDGSSPEHAQNNELLSTYTAGVVPQDNWNNLMQSSWGTQQVTDDSGTLLATTVSVNTSWANGNVVLSAPDDTNGDRLMMNGGMDNGGGAQGWTITNIPYATYDVYIYYDGGANNGRGGSYQVWDSDDGDNVLAAQSGYDTEIFDGTYIQATGTGLDDNGTPGDPSDDTPLNTNYVVLTGLTAPNIKIQSLADMAGTTDTVLRAPMNGFQIVEVGGGGGPAIELIITPNGSDYDFTWTSLDSKVYDLVSSTDLSIPISTWPVWEGNADIDGTAPSNTLTAVAAGPESTRFFAVIEKDPPPLFTEGFESGDGGFTLKVAGGGFTPAGSVWEDGAPDSTSPGGVVNSGNDGSDNCFGTNIGLGDDGHYGVPTETCLHSAVIDLNGVTAAELTFAEALDLQAGDTAVVNIIEELTDNVLGAAVYTADDSGEVNAADWFTVPAINLTAYVGQKIRVEWCLSGTTATYMGWYIDDVLVTDTSP